MKLIEHKQIRMGSFREPMDEIRVGLVRGRRWNLGRLRFLEIGVISPIGDIAVNFHEAPDGAIPMQEPIPHMNLRFGKRLTFRLF